MAKLLLGKEVTDALNEKLMERTAGPSWWALLSRSTSCPKM